VYGLLSTQFTITVFTVQTAVLYHMVHTCALGIVAASYQSGASKKRYAGYLFVGGILFFCGPLYGIVMMNEKKPLNAITPYGGTMFILGWLALGFL
jgi:uncharacterized membrane protein YgdD (TMEM256/DUF423 family)